MAGIPQKAEGSWEAPELANGEVAAIDAGADLGTPDAAVVEADNAVAEAIAAAQNAAVAPAASSSRRPWLAGTPSGRAPGAAVARAAAGALKTLKAKPSQDILGGLCAAGAEVTSKVVCSTDGLLSGATGQVRKVWQR